MKALIVASLFTVAVAVAENNNCNNDAVAASQQCDVVPARRAMHAMFDSEDPDCLYCNDMSFLLAAQDALDICPTQLKVLQNRLNVATTDLAVDSAWGYFCTGTCLANIAKIDDDHTCCMGDHSAMAMNIRFSCERSSSSGRYCGAELSNLKLVNCSAPTEAQCTTKSTCQWDATAGVCYFNGDATALTSVCTECNKKYFTNYWAGGIFDPAQHAVYASQFSNFCGVTNGTSTYAVAAAVGWRIADGIGSTDINNRVCPNTPAGRRAKQALRSTSSRIAEGLRHKALNDWVNCTADDVACQRWLEDNFNQAAAIDAAANAVCVKNPSSNTYCTATAATLRVAAANDCVIQTLKGDTCAASCETKNANFISSLGCCAATYGFNGFANSNSNISSASEAQYTFGVGYFNRTAWAANGPANGYRAVLSDEEYKSRRQAATAFVSGNDGLGIVRSCGNVDSASADEQCAASAPKATRSYEFSLALKYAEIANNKFPEYLKSALAVDVAAAIGISLPQISSITFKASTKAIVRILGVNWPATVATIAITADNDDDNQGSDDLVVALNRGKSMLFPSFGPELAFTSPKAYPNNYVSFFTSAYAVQTNVGDSPLSELAQKDLTGRTDAPFGGNDAFTASATVGAAVAAAVIAALLV